MKQILTTLMLYMLIVCFVISSVTYADGGGVEVQSLHTQTLHFSKHPIRIDCVVAMPDEAIAIVYYAAGTKTNHEEYRLDLFAADGKPILSKLFCQIKPGEAPSPHAQIILQKDSFLCEYYPDITSMEVCYRTEYSYSGNIVSKEKKVKLKYGEAYYADHVEGYMTLKQAHGYDEPNVSPYQAVEIIHLPTAQRVSLSLYDWSKFCPFVGSDGDLFIAQKNEHGNLEIRRYDTDADMQESVAEFGKEYFYGKRFAYILSATSLGDLAYLQVRLSNEEAAILIYDMEKEIVIASSTLSTAPGSDYIASIQGNGSVLLAVDGRWNDTLQRYVLTIDVLDENMGRIPVALMHAQCISILQSDTSGKLVTIEVDEDTLDFYVCYYGISVP